MSLLNTGVQFVSFHIESHLLRSIIHEHTLLSKSYLFEQVRNHFVDDCVLFLPNLALTWIEGIIIRNFVYYFDPNPEIFTASVQEKVYDEENDVYTVVERTPKNICAVPTTKRMLLKYGSEFVVLGITYPIRTLLALLQCKRITFGEWKNYFNGTLPISDLYCGFGYHFAWRFSYSFISGIAEKLLYKIAQVNMKSIDDDNQPNYAINLLPGLGIGFSYVAIEVIRLYSISARLRLKNSLLSVSNILLTFFLVEGPFHANNIK